MISNLRARLPRAEFSGISLSNRNFVERHGSDAFPLSGTDRPFQGMSQESFSVLAEETKSVYGKQGKKVGISFEFKQKLKRTPFLGPCFKRLRSCVRCIRKEFGHCVLGYRFLRAHDLLIVSGGGQLDEEWGGPWGHPFALFKWAVLARAARVPCAIISVGAGKVNSVTSRMFLSFALWTARYRSYRDQNTKRIATRLLKRATEDLVVPDLAFSLPCSELPGPKGIRSIAGGRTIFAVSPIAFAKPASWPHADGDLYERYLRQMARMISQLLERDAFVVMVWSALTDKDVIHDILEHCDSHTKSRLERQVHIPVIDSWRDLVAVLLEVDFLVASRLHSAILGFVSGRPTVAISFDPKVDWVMADLGQTDYLLQIHDFVAEDVIDALGRLEFHKGSARVEISSYRQRILSESATQYDTVAKITVDSSRSQSRISA
jgi:polysaccharide pyruvyl transferase WcaK-like protein